MWKQYDHTHVHAPEVHTWDTTRGERGDESEFSFWFCSFGFGCNSSSVFGAQNNCTQQWLRRDGGWGGEATTLSAGREIRSWWLVILIFLVLCQTGRASYLCDQPTNPAVSDWGAFFWSWFGLLADGTAGMLLLLMMMMVMTMARAAAGRVLYRFKQSSFRNRRHPWPGQCCHVLTSGAACPVGWEYADQMRFFQARRLREPNLPA